MSIEKLPISEDLVPAAKQLRIQKWSQVLGVILAVGTIVFPMLYNKLEGLCPDTVLSRQCFRNILR